MNKLKSAFDAVRSFKGQSVVEASNELGVSKTMLNMFFKGHATSAPLEQKVRRYIEESDLFKCVSDLGLDPNATKEKLANCKQ